MRGEFPTARLVLAGPQTAETQTSLTKLISELGIAPFLSSTLDGPWGIAASLQLAAAERLSLACGLATLELFDAELAAAIPPPEGGLLAVPPGPGLGIEPSGRALGEVLVEEVE